jgi:hypothetical protein
LGKSTRKGSPADDAERKMHESVHRFVFAASSKAVLGAAQPPRAVDFRRGLIARAARAAKSRGAGDDECLV